MWRKYLYNETINIPRVANLLFLVYTITWEALRPLIFRIDNMGRVGMVLLVIAILFNATHLSFWKTFKAFPVFIWTIWVVYVLIVWSIIGLYNHSDTRAYYVYRHFLLPVIALWISCYEIRRFPIETMKIILLAFFIYVFIGIVFQVGLEGHNGRGGRILGNELPLTSLPFIALAAILNVKGKLSNFLFGVCVFLSLYSTFMVATRKALFGTLIILIFWFLGKRNIKKASTIIIAIVFGILTYLFYVYIMDFTVIGDRLDKTEEYAKNINFKDREYLKFLGDRAIYYIDGWKLFTKNPVFGIGIGNYMIVLPSDMPIHSEFMVQLTETGLIGVSLFSLFYYSMFKGLLFYKHSTNDTSMLLTMYGWMFCIMFVNLSSWTYDYVAYFVMFGVLYGVSTSNKFCFYD